MFHLGTFFIQMLHFSVAYILLTTLFFKPVIAFIMQEEEGEKKRLEAVVLNQALIAKKTTENQELWSHAQKQLQQSAPEVELVQPSLEIVESLGPVSVVQKEQVITDLAKFVVDRVVHD